MPQPRGVASRSVHLFEKSCASGLERLIFFFYGITCDVIFLNIVFTLKSILIRFYYRYIPLQAWFGCSCLVLCLLTSLVSRSPDEE